ncbi:hypothetical protein [Salinibaculum rarum]|uniref:hypothetical protein n=1 Tax=Salinibaculum rarum TaxID=3058903 RepID=UPI00265E9F85|nr:hypothetical protein [Salinibaculum sp. KK48]
MQRRKFLVGMGSLAAGGAAAMGTGAFTSAEANRTVNAAVVADESAYLGLMDSDSGLSNDEYAKGSGSGKLQLAFDGNDQIEDPEGFVGGAGSGLGADSTYYFDGVFGVASKSEEQINIDIDWSDLDNPDNFYFYTSYTKPSNYEFTAPEDHTNRVGNGIVAGSYTGVGVAIKTPDSLSAEWETGTITVHAESREELSIGEQ